MKRALILAGAAFAAISVGAFAHAEERREERRERHEIRIERVTRIDANSDGFVTRAEAQAEAERAFGEIDTDNNGKLDAADRGHGRHVIVHRSEHEGGRHHGHHRNHDVDVTVRTEESGERTVIERREVRVAPKGGAGPNAPTAAAQPPAPPRPPRPPMTMMLLMNSEESDLNNDGSLSKEEFVAQQLRFFDASDANRDGKIKFEGPPPMLPEPPQPPAPPQPPRR